MKNCVICGASRSDPKIKEWTHCPEHREVVCISHCQSCQYHGQPEDISNVWCRWYIGRPEIVSKKDQVKKLNYQIHLKEIDVCRLYSRNRPKQAKEMELAVLRLKRELWEVEHG